MGRRSSTICLAVALAAVFTSSGCLFRSHTVPVRKTAAAARTATLNELVNYINQQAAAVQTLNATVDIDTTVGGAKKGKVTEFQQIRGYILVRKPAQLRMIGLFPVVRNRAFDMVSDAEGFKLSIPSKSRFIVGPPEVTTPSKNALENLRPNAIYDALLVHPIDPKDQIAVLENGEEAVVTDEKSKQQTSYPTYIVDVIHRDKEGWHLERKIIFSRTDLMVHRQLIYDKTGNLATEARYENYQEFNGVQFPTSIIITRPQEEYTIGLSVLKLTINSPMTDDQFALNQPPGSTLVRLDQNGNAAPPSPGGGAEKQ